MTDEHRTPRPEDDAARLGLVVVGEAAALQSGDEAALDASEQNIRETIDELVDEPLTPRQEEVVERLASAGGTLTAGLQRRPRRPERSQRRRRALGRGPQCRLAAAARGRA